MPQMVLGGTIYSAMDSPGRPIFGGTTYSMTALFPMCLVHRGSNECTLRVRCRCHGCEIESSDRVKGNSQSMSASRMTNVSTNINSKRSSAMSESDPRSHYLRMRALTCPLVDN